MERTLGGRSGLRVRPDAAAGRGLLDRHPAAHRLRIAARRARFLLHPHGHRRPLPPDDRTCRSSTRSAGTTTGCRPSGGCRTSTGCGAIPRCPTTRRSPRRSPPEKPGKAELPVSRRNFIELCERLTAVDERAFEEMWRRIGLSVDWSLLYTTISDSSRRVSQRAFLRNLARGRGVPGGGADAVGRHLPDRGRAGRARGPRGRRGVPPDLVPRRRRVAGVDRDHPAGAAARLRGAGGAPGRRAVPSPVRRLRC